MRWERILATQSGRKSAACDTMEIWLLFTVAGMVTSTPRYISVDKNLKREEIQEGSSVTLQWRMKTYCSRCRIIWFFNTDGPSKMGCQNLSDELVIDTSHHLAELSLHNVSKNNSGWYNCNVKDEIPMLNIYDSNWTQLVISESLLKIPSQTDVTEQVPEKPPFVWSEWWMWIAIGPAALILVILAIVCLLMRRRELRRRDIECPIYANTRPVNGSKQPSPRPRPPNTLKMDSSYQNLRTPDVGKRYEHSRRLSPHQ